MLRAIEYSLDAQVQSLRFHPKCTICDQCRNSKGNARLWLICVALNDRISTISLPFSLLRNTSNGTGKDVVKVREHL